MSNNHKILLASFLAFASIAFAVPCFGKSADGKPIPRPGYGGAWPLSAQTVPDSLSSR